MPALPPAAPSDAPLATPESETDPAPNPSASTGAGSPEATEPEIVAADAVVAWQQQDLAARSNGLATTATPAYQQAAADIEPSRVPTSPLTETSLRVEADGQALVDVQLEDGTALVALLVQDETGWLLDDLQPVDGPDAAGAP
ncbi:hypothetical protein [Aquipuribacter hungaricus]|uniref:Uncharacterized protein n=1 Tax=Aquipuribacter hungaricus TaxID=545624 RepID=A0ABV7WB87_9MICO